MKKLFTFISILFFAACSSDDTMPADVLNVDKMKMIIWDMSLADNMASDKYALNKDSQRIMVTGLYNKVFSLHKVDKKSFYKSLSYYEAHPVEMQTLFDSVSAYGMRQKGKAYQKGI